MMTSEELLNAWNELRNAALGRGLNSKRVSPKLAKEVEREWTRYRDATLSPTLLAEFRWLPIYREVLKKVKAEGFAKDITAPKTTVEELGDSLNAVSNFAKWSAITLGVLGASYVTYQLVKGSRG